MEEDYYRKIDGVIQLLILKSKWNVKIKPVANIEGKWNVKSKPSYRTEILCYV